MKRSAVRNFHVPLPEDLYNKLREEAGRSGSPATELARRAIEVLLEQRQRAALSDAIALYAAKHAGTASDLDEALEAASVEHLLSGGQVRDEAR
jgi:hypothetical protein